MNEIFIEALEVFSHIGVPETERALPQRLLLDVVLVPAVEFPAAGDDVGRTVDYAMVAEVVRDVAAGRARRLVETLAVDTARAVLERFAARSVTVTVRKFVLPGTASVGVRYTLAAD